MYKIETIFLIWNIFVFCIYGLDKLFAIRKMRRIRESLLLAAAFMLGSVGAIFGMIIFNHKTAKLKFRILVPASVIFTILVYIKLL